MNERTAGSIGMGKGVLSSSSQPSRNILDFDYWNAEAERLAETYRRAEPFPSIVLNNFLTMQAAADASEAYPLVDWQLYKHYNEDKQGANSGLPEPILAVINELNSDDFLRFLERLTGISNLLADKKLESGGVHQSTRGGFLNIHADFTVHPYNKSWHRRLNVLIYLNSEWKDDWGGHFELWSRDMSRCEKKVAPTFNTCVIFSTSHDSFHGHPDPMTCPPGVTRKSIALYYYTADSLVQARATEYRPRPTDTTLRRMAIYLDKLAVRAFHAMKSTLKVRDSAFTRLAKSLFRSKK